MHETCCFVDCEIQPAAFQMVCVNQEVSQWLALTTEGIAIIKLN